MASLQVPLRALAAGMLEDYYAQMDTMNADTGHSPSLETETERQARIAWEAAGIADADADIAAGRMVDAAAVRAWVESIDTDHELPVPYSGR